MLISEQTATHRRMNICEQIKGEVNEHERITQGKADDVLFNPPGNRKPIPLGYGVAWKTTTKQQTKKQNHLSTWTEYNTRFNQVSSVSEA